MATLNLYAITERRGPGLALVVGCTAEDALHAAAIHPDLLGWQLSNTYTRLVQKNMHEVAPRIVALLLRLTKSRAEVGLAPVDELAGLRAELQTANDKLAAQTVRIRADDAALEYAVDCRARSEQDRERVSRALEREHMAWHDEHEPAVDFAHDILDTAPLAQQRIGEGDGKSWLLLATSSQQSAAEHLAKIGYAELHPVKTWARYLSREERMKTDGESHAAGAPGELSQG